MAHYKRGKSRAQGSGYYSSKGLEHRLSGRYGKNHRGEPDVGNWGWFWYGNWPRNHDIMNHTRPHRSAVRRAEVAVMKGKDPDEVLWPVWGKPHIYYW